MKKWQIKYVIREAILQTTKATVIRDFNVRGSIDAEYAKQVQIEDLKPKADLMVSKVSGKVSGGYKNNKTLEIKRIEGKKAIIVTPDSTNRAGLKLANKEHPRYLSVWVQHPKEDYDDGEFADRI